MRLFKSLGRDGGVDGPVSTLGPNSGTIIVAGLKTIPAYGNRAGLRLASDPAGTGTVYILGGTGTPSATNFHAALSPGQSWDGEVTQSIWTGQVQLYCSGSIAVGVWEV